VEKTMIRVTTGECYKVPEDMFPFAAQNLVDCGRAQWVERKKPGIVDKAKIQTASLLRNAQTAARQILPLDARKAQ
jgi:hypothetical protein